MRLKDKVALVTGGAQGIGRAIGLRFADEGARVAVADVNLESAQKTAEEIAGKGVESLAVKGSVADISEVETMVKTALDKWGRIDILVNNAGITKDNLVLRMTEAEWDAVLNINLKGVFNCTKVVCRGMLKQRSGRIVNIASVVGQMGNAGQVNYAASKGGVIALTKTCAREFSSRGVTVNAIAPGFIRTRMTEVLTDQQKEALKQQIPLGRLGEPEDVAAVCAFLASEDAAYLTGQVLGVNGGMYM